MSCICFHRLRRRKAKQAKNENKGPGSRNAAYVDDDEDDDILQNNAVLAELDQRDAAAIALRENHVTINDDVDTKSGTSMPRENSSSKVTAYASNHLTPSDKIADSLGFTPASTGGVPPPHSTQDDLCLSDYNYECLEVDLLSKDSVGPGFSVTGTLTDGIVVGSLHEKGPAVQSGKISIGDKILSVTIGFDNMAYEDALTILSYAAPYPMTLKLARAHSSQSNTNAGSAAEVNDITSRVYHPVYRSQSVGGGGHSSKKQRKMPSRPGTSLSQIDYATQEMCSREGSQESLGGGLIKDKFGNTLNLQDGSEVNIHRLSDSDTTVDSSFRSDSRLHSTTKLAETEEEVVTTFSVPVQAVAGTTTTYPIVAEVMVTEPPTQIKMATLASGSPTHNSSTGSQRTSRATTPTSPGLIPPEKPKRIHQLLAEQLVVPQAVEVAPSGDAAVEEDIIPCASPRDQQALPEWMAEEVPQSKTVPSSADNADISTVSLGIPSFESNEDKPASPSAPVEETTIEPTKKVRQVHSNVAAFLSVNSRSVDQKGKSEHQTKMAPSPIDVSADKSTTLTTDKSTVLTAEKPATLTVEKPMTLTAEKPTTLTVDTVKIKDSTELVLDPTNPSRYSVNAPEQPSPNDSGIHSEKALSERDDPLSPSCDTGSGGSSPSLTPMHTLSNSTDDLMTAVLGLSSPKAVEEPEEATPSSTPSSQISTPRSAKSATKYSQPEPVIPKATSRSQLEAARARFFAELMQSSDIFKESPTEQLSFSSESVNTDTTTAPPDPFKKYRTSSSAATNNNNSLTNSYNPAGSRSSQHESTA